MSDRTLHPRNVAGGAVVIGGTLIAALPAHALTIVQLVIVTTAVSAAVYVLAANVPEAGWISPFRWLSPFGRAPHPAKVGHRARDLDLIRANLADRRQRIAHGPPLPPAVLRRLRPLIATALEVDVRDERQIAGARDRVSPLTYAVLTSEPLERGSWLRTTWPNPRAVADAVVRVLDDIDPSQASAT